MSKIKVSGVPYEVDIDTLEQENRLMRARMERLEEENIRLKKREWVGLTEEEFFDLLSFDGRLNHVETPLIADFIRTIQAKLKEKNT